jgi:hypothetical protein
MCEQSHQRCVPKGIMIIKSMILAKLIAASVISSIRSFFCIRRAKKRVYNCNIYGEALKFGERLFIAD